MNTFLLMKYLWFMNTFINFSLHCEELKNIKFIIAGDFQQLLPVNDRIECDYKISPALYELCDGQRLQLSKCRRSNDSLFNILDITNLNKKDFNKSTNKLYMNNLCFTNLKRKEINNLMMEKYINNKISEAKDTNNKY